jgi:hypothetical protein
MNIVSISEIFIPALLKLAKAVGGASIMCFLSMQQKE